MEAAGRLRLPWFPFTTSGRHIAVPQTCSSPGHVYDIECGDSFAGITHLHAPQVVSVRHVQPCVGQTLIKWHLKKMTCFLPCGGHVSGSRLLLLKDTYF